MSEFKKKGPIRFEAILPIGVIFALVFTYFSFFFDGHLQSGIEWLATRVNGAEVNVARVKTSFLTPSFHMFHLQVTDKNQPERNLFEVAQINFVLTWDALLRAKVVIKDASIDNIQALTPRRRPGRVIPPSQEPSKLKVLEAQILEQTKEQFNENIMGDVANVMGGARPQDQLQNLQDQLQSEKRIKQIETELKQKEQEWKARLEKLPQEKELKDYEARFKALKFDGNPQQVANAIKQADQLVKELDAKIKLVESTGKDLDRDSRTYTTALQEIEALIQQDLKDLQSRLKIPSLDPQEFTMGLLGGLFQGRLVEVQKYMALAREYMPPAKAEDAETTSETKSQALIPRPRKEGENIQFRITKGYPTFWLKRAAISSEPSHAEYSGRLKGELTHLTTSQSVVGEPTIFNIEGDFPKKNIFDFKTQLVIDHVTETPRENLLIEVGSYPQDQITFSSSSDLKFGLTKAKASSRLEAKLANNQVDLVLSNRWEEAQYKIEAKEKLVQEILTNVMAGIATVTLNARARGSWSKLDLNMNSNLGDAIARGFKAELENRINEAKAQINRLVRDRVGSEQEKLMGEVNRFKGQVESVVASKQKELKQAQSGIQKQVQGQKKQEKKKIEEKGRKLLRGLNF